MEEIVTLRLELAETIYGGVEKKRQGRDNPAFLIYLEIIIEICLEVFSKCSCA